MSTIYIANDRRRRKTAYKQYKIAKRNTQTMTAQSIDPKSVTLSSSCFRLHPGCLFGLVDTSVAVADTVVSTVQTVSVSESESMMDSDGVYMLSVA